MKSGESIAQQMVATLWIPGTPGENINATTKIRNNYGAIQSFKFTIAILDFSLLLLVKLSLLIIFTSFLVSVLCFFL